MFLAKIILFSKISRQLCQNVSEEARHCCCYNITQLGKKKTLPSRLLYWDQNYGITVVAVFLLNQSIKKKPLL